MKLVEVILSCRVDIHINVFIVNVSDMMIFKCVSYMLLVYMISRLTCTVYGATPAVQLAIPTLALPSDSCRSPDPTPDRGHMFVSWCPTSNEDKQ